MIIIHHNFDETKFKWLWAKYVKAGVIEKHCTASIPGLYSKKFSGTSNKDLLSQPSLLMDEVPEDSYEAIYFCGVLKKGYLHKDPLKNNYRHNVHFAVRPQEGAHDVWDFENWHVEIENGVLERIPETYELHEKFFTEPYNPHYYTCRIFRWMIGHFYPENVLDIPKEYARKSSLSDTEIDKLRSEIDNCIRLSKNIVDSYMSSNSLYILNHSIDNGSVIRKNLASNLIDRIKELVDVNEYVILGNNLAKFIELGVENALEMYFPYLIRKTYLEIIK